ncbi:hypothetical protein BN1708_001840 [Verticillium longisporum]|uniref:Uncharacterized protein n=1 Tax=Verticillium longisporum TaxID=100787 RepID=A0A0G4N4I7_VERLO|nr:hypothetical protein BN1708_001840 [Verticillium longisporum]
MAQPTPSLPTNGTAASSSPALTPAPDHIGTPESSHSNVPVKRKREDDEHVKDDDNADADADMDIDDAQPPKEFKDLQSIIRDYFKVLTSYDTTPSILQRPLRVTETENEPDAKRQKSSNGAAAVTIADKVAQEQYTLLDDLADDLLAAAADQLAELESSRNGADAEENRTFVDGLVRFKKKALELFRREKNYPRGASDPQQKMQPDAATAGRVVLTLSGSGRQLFSSQPRPARGQQAVSETLSRSVLPVHVSSTRILPSRQTEHTYTLGELFASPRPLPPLQPPKQPKPQAKGNVLNFCHPEIPAPSKYRTNTYFTQKVTVGHFLDYSNAASSTSQSKEIKQRQRAQSLAGHKPSSSELEVSEMESLFRAAFSSFAPCKDDSAAMVPASLAGRMYWQQTGQRTFNRMVEAELQENEDDLAGQKPDATPQIMDIDEELIQEAIDNWDDKIDPALEIWGPQKTDEEKDTEELLKEVDDLIFTLASYQRIRNTSLPSSHNKYAGDPSGGDMLASGTGANPSEEEIATYEALKAQLGLIVKMLPPFAVAKLNGDQLNDLLVSTSLEVRTDQYKGVMEDEGAAQARARQQHSAASAATGAARPSGAHRTPSAPSYNYGNNQPYGTPTRQGGPPQYYHGNTQTPIQQQPHLGRPAAPHTMPHPQYRQPPPQQPPQQGQQFRTQNTYPNQYAAQLAKTQTPFGHQNVPQYATQPRPQQYAYNNTGPQASPTARFQPGYGQTYQPNQAGYTNGAANMQKRTMSPQVPAGQYSPSPPLPQQQHHQPHPQHMPHMQHQQPRAPYGSPVNRPQYPNGTHSPGPNAHVQGRPPPYMNSVTDQNQQRLLEQARARAAAQQNSNVFGDKMQQGGMANQTSYNPAQLAAQQARLVNNVANKPQSPAPRQGQNGTPTIPARVTPVPVPVIPGAQQQQQQQQG